MKGLLRGLAVAVLCVPTAALAQGIRNSDHDLSSSSGVITGLKSSSVNEICIFCHTPHRALTSDVVWNHEMTAATSWSWGTDLDGNVLTSTEAGTTLPTTLRSPSKRCLSCHDGSIAIGDVSNAGGGVQGTIPGLANIPTYTSASGNLIDTNKLVGTVTGAVGNMSGNHPISIPYAGQTAYNGINSAVPASWLGGAVGGYYDVTTAGCTNGTGICTTAPASDGRNGAAINLIPNVPGSTTNVGVECNTCHEPHNMYGYPYFTRIDVTNASGLCRSCHNK